MDTLPAAGVGTEGGTPNQCGGGEGGGQGANEERGFLREKTPKGF